MSEGRFISCRVQEYLCAGTLIPENEKYLVTRVLEVISNSVDDVVSLSWLKFIIIESHDYSLSGFDDAETSGTVFGVDKITAWRVLKDLEFLTSIHVRHTFGWVSDKLSHALEFCSRSFEASRFSPDASVVTSDSCLSQTGTTKVVIDVSL